MLRLQCYLFGKLVRESRDRPLTGSEREFLDRHRSKCEMCQARESTTHCALEGLVEAKLDTLPAESNLPLIQAVHTQVSEDSYGPNNASLSWVAALSTCAVIGIISVYSGVWGMLASQIPLLLHSALKVLTRSSG